jgi:hypothetical protein
VGGFLTPRKIAKSYGFFQELWYDDKYHPYVVDLMLEGGRRPWAEGGPFWE